MLISLERFGFKKTDFIESKSVINVYLDGGIVVEFGAEIPLRQTLVNPDINYEDMLYKVIEFINKDKQKWGLRMLISLDSFGFSEWLSFRADDIKRVAMVKKSMSLRVYCSDGDHFYSETFEDEDELKKEFYNLVAYINLAAEGGVEVKGEDDDLKEATLAVHKAIELLGEEVKDAD